MQFDPDQHHRRSIRLLGYDYGQAGAYFVTVCAHGRECLFGDVVHGQMPLNRFGEIAMAWWQWLAEQYPYVELDSWVVMPNHLHGIIVVSDDRRRGGSRTAPTSIGPADTPLTSTARTDRGSPCALPGDGAGTIASTRKPLGRLIGAFKTVSTKHINLLRGTPGVPVWQRNYYEHVIRDEASLQAIRAYIAENPLRWALDPENLANIHGEPQRAPNRARRS